MGEVGGIGCGWTTTNDLMTGSVAGSNDPATLLAAAKLAEPHCVAIDLNLGCPQRASGRAVARGHKPGCKPGCGRFS